MRKVMYPCVGGGVVGADGVCTEHGETACVMGVMAAALAESDREYTRREILVARSRNLVRV